MTYEETKRLLSEVRWSRTLAQAAQRRLEELESDYSALTLHSGLGGGAALSSGACSSNVERAYELLERARERFYKRLSEYMTFEDKLVDAIDTLTPFERDIIIDCYLNGEKQPQWKIAQRLGVCDRTLRRRQEIIIRKLAKRI